MKTKMSLENAMQWEPATGYTEAQKIFAFDRLYDNALEHFREIKKEGYTNDDVKAEIYEEVMELLGDKVWLVINVLTG